MKHYVQYKKLFISTLIGIACVVGVFSARADWTPPNNPPPTCTAGDPGCDAPVNIGTTGQIKNGAFGVNGILSALGSIFVTTGSGASFTTVTQRPTLTLSENSSSSGPKAWLQFFNGGVREAFIRLAHTGPSAQPRLEISDNSDRGAGLDLLDGGVLSIYENKDCAGCASKKGTLWFSDNGDFHVYSSGTKSTYLNWFAGSGGVRVGNGAQTYGPIYASAFTVTPSTRASKTNIRNITYGLDTIMNLLPVHFQYKNDPNTKNQIGFIAEDVANTVPEAVSFDNDGHVEGIDLSKLTVPLTRATQELKIRQDSLTKRIESLEQANGMVLKARDGENCFRVTVDNNGTLATEKTTCKE